VTSIALTRGVAQLAVRRPRPRKGAHAHASRLPNARESSQHSLALQERAFYCVQRSNSLLDVGGRARAFHVCRQWLLGVETSPEVKPTVASFAFPKIVAHSHRSRHRQSGSTGAPCRGMASLSCCSNSPAGRSGGRAGALFSVGYGELPAAGRVPLADAGRSSNVGHSRISRLSSRDRTQFSPTGDVCRASQLSQKARARSILQSTILAMETSDDRNSLP
jgi:hypothetical protein